MSTLLSALSQARHAAHLKLSDLEERTGVPASRLSLLLRDGPTPDARLSTVEALADALDQKVMVIPKELAPLVQQILETGSPLTEITESPSALQQTLNLRNRRSV